MKKRKASNITWHDGDVTREERERAVGQRGVTVWMTGLSGSGKSTVGCVLEKRLLEMGLRAYRLDGDNVRHGLNSDLGFSADDREENIRRIGEVAKLFADSCAVVVVSFISPYRADRERARKLRDEAGLGFVEVYVKVSLEVAEERDPKGLYKKAREGEIKGFTGIDDPYEEPVCAEVVIDTDEMSVEESVAKIVGYLKEKGLVGVA